jgi:hypothetical protein
MSRSRSNAPIVCPQRRELAGLDPFVPGLSLGDRPDQLRIEAVSRADARTALQVSAEDVLDRRVLEREVGVHALELRVLSLELFDAPQLVDRGLGVFAALGTASRG